MALPIQFRPEAVQDLAEARDWYEQCVDGLGQRFMSAVDEFLERVSTFPELYAILTKNVRYGKLKRFPHVVYYRLLADKIEVLAVLHGKRRAAVWRRRLRNV